MPASDRFLQAARNEPTDRVPVWLMRQAGRYQPSYRELRKRHGMLEIALSPQLAAEVTVRPVQDYGLDAAILFSDIMVPLGPAGVRYEIREGVGPVVEEPVRTGAAVAALAVYDAALREPETAEAVERAVAALDGVPLIGFAGAPFTLASYLVEGRPSRTYAETKRLMWSRPATWGALMDVLSDIVLRHLILQVKAGAAAVQLFDSWAGALSPSDYEASVLPYVRRIFQGLEPYGVPRIYFAVGAGHLTACLAATGATVLGIDWRQELSSVRRQLGPELALQGNLDPVALLAPWAVTEERARAVLEGMAGEPGYIFNLGHGVLPTTEPDQVLRLARFVHEPRFAAHR
jgi:uroporphyrinogen decarboxylase